jgi:glyoxylase-like metal-dependent hydrolase (beta-lactamase superfamily II)
VTAVPFLAESQVRYGQAEAVTTLVRRVVANNPGPYTYHGTCTYLVGRGQVGVVDPGPDDPAHLDAILAALASGERISHILVTHTHRDHSPAAPQLQARTGAPIYGFGPPSRLDDPDPTRVVFHDPDADPPSSEPPPSRERERDFRPDFQLRDGDVVEVDDWSLDVVHTPGHATNHLCYLVREEGALCTGDHVMGWSTSVVSPPDGNLAEYMASLERLLERPQDRRYLPGHGPPVTDPQSFVRALVAHRRERTAQILDALTAGPATIAELVPRLYADRPKHIWAAASSSVYAHLLHLGDAGVIETVDGAPLQRSSRVRRQPDPGPGG